VIIDGKRAARNPTSFKAHLSTCDGCTGYLRQMRKVIRWTGLLSEEQVKGGARQKLLEAFRNWKK
jgi:hypothetical protein